MNSSDRGEYDLIGCGFGPANLALAVAIVESWEKWGRVSFPLKRVCFIEKYSSFQWHPGMLLPDTIMQISCLKDLATLRNPSSPFTFLSYLHEHNRLVSFINRGSMIPTRKEYADYLFWAAQRVQNLGIEIFYGEEVISLESSDQDHIQCNSQKDDRKNTRHTRNIVIAPGGIPRIPSTFAHLLPSPVIFHTSTYCQSIETAFDAVKGDAPRPLRIGVLGSGQSAVEAFLDARSRLFDIAPMAQDSEFPSRHEIDLIIRKDSLKPSDDSPFSNEVFDPESTDKVYNLPTEQSRQRLLAEYRNTNYSVVNSRTLGILYEHIYNQKIDQGVQARFPSKSKFPCKSSHPHLRILNNQSVIQTSISPSPDGLPATISLALQNTLTRELTESRPYDIIILATGYERKAHVKLLEGKGIAKLFGFTSDLPAQGEAVPLPSLIKGADIYSASSLQESASRNPSSSETSATPPSFTTENTSPGTSLGTSLVASSNDSTLPLLYRINIGRNYRIIPKDCKEVKGIPRFYLLGYSESTHGISETLLSVASVRAGEILGDILGDKV